LIIMSALIRLAVPVAVISPLILGLGVAFAAIDRQLNDAQWVLGASQ
jgi:hypothetical protein